MVGGRAGHPEREKKKGKKIQASPDVAMRMKYYYPPSAITVVVLIKNVGFHKTALGYESRSRSTVIA